MTGLRAPHQLPAWLPYEGGHNTGIHGLRGVAAAMVLFAHIVGGTAEHIYADNAAYLAVSEPLWNFGTFFVYLFFAISGFVILPSAFRYAPRDFAIRRILRIYPLFLVFTLIFIAGNAAMNLQPKLNDLPTILYALTFTNLLAGTEQLTPNAWSLTYEMMFYCLAGLGAFAISQKMRGLQLIMALASLAFLVVFPKSLYFVAGILVFILYGRRFVQKLPMRPVLEVIAALSLGYAASRAHFDFRAGELREPITLICMALTFLYFLFAVEKDSVTARLLSARWAQYLGTISYSLYLAHPYIYMPMRVVFQKLGLFSENAWLSVTIFGLVTFVAAIAASHVSYLLFEKLPVTMFRNWRGRDKALQKDLSV
ncbi:acyltransferase [Aliiroseovarius sp. F20344]|uniref:acyltransferase family protein n=1 Tax=Aliiroseovarius sp. F20344 TaxID=2926414 RepID=UPI001FF693C3|nr:acyltransferase [Aliiroseovarius sp. F20344]MCK0143095.1 acyltransferase [Aliiroseovarius sp. F20344]